MTSRRHSRPRLAPFLTLVALGWLVASAAAVDVEEVHWGFDGRAMPGRINPLSLLLRNNTGEDYEGVVRLRREDGIGHARGAPLVADVYLSPFTARWVQLYPYVPGTGETWRLHLSGADSVELPQPRSGPPGIVYLADPRAVGGASPGIPSLPEDVFPPTVAATDGLHAVVLDHVPRWEPVRREAFRDWLKRGGTVHLLKGEGGAFPAFTAELAPLNIPRDRTRVGAGLVVRHDVPPGQINERYLAARGYPLPQLVDGAEYFYEGFDGLMLRKLNVVVQPEHSWGLIYIVLLAYIAFVGLVNWLLGRKSRGFMVPTGFFLVSVALASGVFTWVGRRGFDVDDPIHTVSYARHIEGDLWDVTQWSNVFARSGDYYRIAHPGGPSLYSTCQMFESVRGRISAAGGGSFYVDIPVCSSRSFLHRSRMTAPDLGLQVSAWERTRGGLKLRLSAGPAFPRNPRDMWAYADGRFMRLARHSGALEAANAPGANRDAFLGGDLFDGEGYYGYGRPYGGRSMDASRLFASCAEPLLAWATGGTEHFRRYIRDPAPDPDAVDVFIYAQSPPDLAAEDLGIGSEVGYTMYHVRLFKPEGTDD